MWEKNKSVVFFYEIEAVLIVKYTVKNVRYFM